MARSFREGLKTVVKNMVRHGKAVAHRDESARDALAGVARDAQKLGRTLTSEETRELQSKVDRLMKKGRAAYNDGDYSQAEGYFRRAIKADPQCAWAHTYLGHALYKQKRTTQAVQSWSEAIKIDPDSDAAAKARKKQQHVAKQKLNEDREWKERLGG